MILCEETIENYKAFKKSYTNEKIDFTVTNTLLDEMIQDSNMIQGDKKEVFKYYKARNILIGRIKICGLTRIKRKCRRNVFKVLCK